MNTRQPSRTDLIIGMTLAEVFLLLLFLVWWGATAESRPEPPTPCEAERDRLSKEVERLTNKVSDLETSIREKDGRIEALRIMLDSRGTGMGDFKEALDRKLAEARRGSPKCEAENVLVDVEVQHGGVGVTMVGGSEEVLAKLTSLGAGEVRKGMVLSDRVAMDRLLSAVQLYYQGRSECRFDYRLTYSTAEDYHEARSLFERYLYPAGIVRKP